MIKALLKSALSALAILFAIPLSAQDLTATWDFQHAFAQSEVSIQKTTGQVASDVSGVELFVDATNGKLQSRGTDAQFNKGTIIRIPVKSTRDYVSVVSYPGYHNYTVGGKDADADSVAHKATSAEVKNGYVEVVGTNASYLYRIHTTFVSAIQEKGIYDTDFRDWAEVDRKANNETPSVYNLKTKYSHEDFTMTLCGVGAYPNGTNSKFSDITGFIESAKYTNEVKTQEPYAITSALASVSKITFHQVATGGNRGWAVACRTIGTENWDTIYYKSIAKSSGEDVTVDVNRQNVEIKFFPFNISQNAYMTELHIYGMVDMSKSPSLATFTANGITYQAADIFDEDSNGNNVATVEISKKESMINSSNAITTTVDNGTVGNIIYKDVASDVNGNKTACDVTVPVYLDNDTAIYVISFVWKPDYVVNYYNTDGKIIATQKVEKGDAIGSLNDGSSVTVPSGSKFRGWLLSSNSKEKATVEKIVDEPVLDLYALVTRIEGTDAKERNSYDFRDKYFYFEDHEGITVDGEYSYNGPQHGIKFNKGGSIALKVTNYSSKIFVEMCSYSKGKIEIEYYDTFSAPENDGTIYSIDANEPGLIVLKINDDDVYIHRITVRNFNDSDPDCIFSQNGAGMYVATPGDATSVLDIIDHIAADNAYSGNTNNPSGIFLPNGVYDFGDMTEITIPFSNLSIIGQSMDSTILVTKPDISKEGLGTADFIFNNKDNLYLQDLTLKNALDYYGAGAAGRAAVIQDRGNRTIFKNVRMLSYQDTYYSQNNGMQSYFEDCDIHGTVDFICGGGDVRFQNSTITLEKRNSNGTGGRTITAPTTTTNYGYVFDNCKIVDLSEGKGNWNFGRTWQNNPKAVFLNTTLDDVAASTIVSSRWTEKGMNNKDPQLFGEYGTVNEQGVNITPASNKINSYGGTFETILNAAQADEYAYDKMFSDWNPKDECKQEKLDSIWVDDSWDEIDIRWNPSADNQNGYAIFKNNKFVDMKSAGVNYYGPCDDGVWTVKPINSRLGLGQPISINLADVTGISDVSKSANVVKAEYYNISGYKVNKPTKGAYIEKKTYSNGKVKTSKVIIK